MILFQSNLFVSNNKFNFFFILLFLTLSRLRRLTREWIEEEREKIFGSQVQRSNLSCLKGAADAAVVAAADACCVVVVVEFLCSSLSLLISLSLFLFPPFSNSVSLLYVSVFSPAHTYTILQALYHYSFVYTSVHEYVCLSACSIQDVFIY